MRNHSTHAGGFPSLDTGESTRQPLYAVLDPRGRLFSNCFFNAKTARLT